MKLKYKKQEVLKFLNNEYDKYRAKPNLGMTGSFTEPQIRTALFFKTTNHLDELPLILKNLVILDYIDREHDKYIITLKGKEFLNKGGFNPVLKQKIKLFFINEDNIWKIISPVISGLIGIVVGYIIYKLTHNPC